MCKQQSSRIKCVKWKKISKSWRQKFWVILYSTIMFVCLSQNISKRMFVSRVSNNSNIFTLFCLFKREFLSFRTRLYLKIFSSKDLRSARWKRNAKSIIKHFYSFEMTFTFKFDEIFTLHEWKYFTFLFYLLFVVVAVNEIKLIIV